MLWSTALWNTALRRWRKHTAEAVGRSRRMVQRRPGTAIARVVCAMGEAAGMIPSYNR